MGENCRVYQSAEFFGTDHRLVVATLKLHVKSRRISRGNHTVFHLEKLKDLTCAHEYAVAVSNRFDVLGALGDPVELWDTFKRETLQAAKECIGERPRSRRGFVSTETLEKIEESRAARLAGNRDQHRALSCRTRTLLGRDKERYVRSLAEDVEGHLNANDLRPAYRALKKLRSKSPSRASAIRTADGRLVSDMDGQMARWAEYFGQLFTVDPPTEQLHTTGLQAVDADPPIDETAPSLDEVREAVAKLRGGKAAGVCNISAELLKAGIRSHLVKHQRPQQSGFTPGKSTTDRILALRVLVERRREFRQGMLAAYVDLKKAFDSVHRVRQGCVLAPSLFNACMDWVLDKVVDQSDCGASVGNTKITDLVFADDAVIFAESLEVLVMALEALHEEAKPLGLEVSWLKTKVQVFGDLLDEAVQSVHACGEDIEILESFTYLGSAVHNDGGSRQEVLRRIGIAHGVMDSLSGSIWRCRYLCRRTKIWIFKSLVIPVLLYGCETWTLNSDLKKRINAFGQSKSLRLFFSDRDDTCGQLVIASRESQYKIFHFHHGGLDKLAAVFEDWNFLVKPRDEETPTPDASLKQFLVCKPEVSESELHPEEGEHRCLDADAWVPYFNEDGQIEDDLALRRAIFFGGVEPQLRANVWPFLLHYYDFRTSFLQRQAVMEDKHALYSKIHALREAMVGEELDWFRRNVQCTVEKDVVRTDRSNPCFAGNDNPNLDKMKRILLNFATHNPVMGYTQGMSDILAPILAEVRNEADVFWCFTGLMSKTIFVTSPKDEDMEKNLSYLRELLRLMTPRFYHHMASQQDGMDLLFCHRWILLCFKREFPEDEALAMWEACWSNYQTDYFHLFLSVAIVSIYGADVVDQNLRPDETLLYFTSLAGHMHGTMVLKKARGLLHQYRSMSHLPCTLVGLCELCGPGMWDSGHVPVVACVGHSEDQPCPLTLSSSTPGTTNASTAS
ncbi:TBC1 domain family member 16 [Chionoecetes opilio]|uniref:TBC1 domain family member 16 n=1 Tax=Chionoecetes opilio TaxID=41210 RepID=A0A8J5CHB1_CHIOP|nr:TBC1 domain family member 16 [Chionoecetes opilio]